MSRFVAITLIACAVPAFAGAAACVIATSAGAGPLNPPAGPIAPTARPLSEVEPRTPINATNTPGDGDSVFKITQPGSYYLAGNVSGASGKMGIEIATHNVTIDLMGFSVLGVTGSLDGILAAAGTTNIVVLNGTITGWGQAGLDFSGVTIGGRLHGLHVRGNADNGLIAGNAFSITDCSAYNNTGHGIYTFSCCVLERCSSRENTVDGFNCTAACTVTNCSALSNGRAGISAANNCVVSTCAASDNSGNGINVGLGSSVTWCTSGSNGLNGIQANSRCQIIGNACGGNGQNEAGGAGIRTTGSDSRIADNNCSNQDRGIEIVNSGNIIIRNTCASNTTNWVIAGSNYYGPIIDRAGVVTPAVNGSAAADTLGSAHPNANFSY